MKIEILMENLIASKAKFFLKKKRNIALKFTTTVTIDVN